MAEPVSTDSHLGQRRRAVFRSPAVAAAGGILLTAVVALVAFALLRQGTVGISPPTDAAAAPELPIVAVQRAGPDPLDVAERYFRFWDAGDVEGYEELVAPEANLFTQRAAADVAIDSWYRIATGVTLERTCGMSGPGRVRCETTLVSGLQPGVVIAESTPTVLAISGGQIVDFQFPEGFQTISDRDIVGFTAYREWMEDNEPADFRKLFLVPETIVVNSPEARARHAELIARFLVTVPE